jgi:type II secretory pathway component GspD/PulD (secretin)
VLGEQESETQNRTPGIASLPIIGNLFKRKGVARQSSEILFFITPRIYRPDYNGQPTNPIVGNGQGNRSTTIAQPVPMGNPQSNTPTPTQLQQQQQSQPQTTPQTTPPVVPGASTRPGGSRP